ncbi:formate/nitrite transporter family protein [Verrucomicrobiota bacterium]
MLFSRSAAVKRWPGVCTGMGLEWGLCRIGNLVRGFLCNFPVVMAYQMALFVRDFSGKVPATLFPVELFVLRGFEHRMANVFLIPF